LNALLREDRAIVNPLPGTTRDVLEETVNIHGLPVRILDTAGLRSPKDEIEEEGIRRTLRAVETAGFVLAAFDASQPLHTEDLEALTAIKGKTTLAVLNKSDLACKLSGAELAPWLSGGRFVQVSAKTGSGVDRLRQAVYDTLLQGKAIGGNPVFA